jgi:hypothetical protein
MLDKVAEAIKAGDFERAAQFVSGAAAASGAANIDGQVLAAMRALEQVTNMLKLATNASEQTAQAVNQAQALLKDIQGRSNWTLRTPNPQYAPIVFRTIVLIFCSLHLPAVAHFAIIQD